MQCIVAVMHTPTQLAEATSFLALPTTTVLFSFRIVQFQFLYFIKVNEGPFASLFQFLLCT